MIKLSVVLPCYNEGVTIRRLVDEYRVAFAGEQGIELILVNNGSTDDTASAIADELERQHPFKILTCAVPVNRGYGYGILVGLAIANGEYVCWSHADLQTPAKYIIQLLYKVIASADPRACFGKGYRISDRGNAIFLTRLHSILSYWILGCRLEEINAQPKLFHRAFLNQFRHPPLGYELDVYSYYKAVRNKMDVVTVDVEFIGRVEGQSKWAYSASSRLRFIARNLIYLFILRLTIHRI